MISQTAEYALRAAVALAREPGESMTTQRIAKDTQVPLDYLAKVLGQMSRAGLVHAQRGLHGGFRLARDAERMSVMDVVGAVEQLPRITSCPLGNPDHDHTMCPLHQHLDRAMAQVEAAFCGTLISELAAFDGASVDEEDEAQMTAPQPAKREI